jgi:putative cell wall-binding protein
MRRLALLAALVAVAVPAVPGGGGMAAAAPDCPLTAFTGRSIVRFDPGVDAVARLRAAGASRVEAIAPGVAVGRLPGGRWPAGARSVTPERLRQLFDADPLRSYQWALDVAHLDQAAPKGDGAGVVVAVLDSGVDGTHPDLAGKVLAGVDATVSPPATIPAGTNSDTVGHGTAVAGVIAAGRDDGVGIAGVAPGARILPVRVGDANGITTAAFLRGMYAARDRGAKVINLSFGGCGYDPAEQAAVNAAVAGGAIVVAAAGNLAPGHEGEQVSVYPAAYDNVIAVGATTRDDGHAPYSVTGSFVDVSAPGGSGEGTPDTDIVVPWLPFAGCPAPCYTIEAGTSFAAPHVSAAVALAWGADPGLSPLAVAGVVLGTAIDLGPPGTDPAFGAGRVDFNGVLAQATRYRGIARVAGGDRYATAVALSRATYPAGAAVAYLARGDTFSPDALAAGPAAIVKGAPVLLTAACELPSVTADELVRLGAREVVVLGGTGAVCDAVAGAVGALATHPAVRRLAGADRYGTAAAIAADTFPGGAPLAYLARGDTFSPDALVGGAAAGVEGAPVLLVAGCEVPPQTASALDALGVSRLVVLGGPQAVCDAAVAAVSPGRAVERVAGPDRYGTAAAVADRAFPGPRATTVVARGDAFSPDALTAAPYAAGLGAPLVLAAQCWAPPPPTRLVNGRDPRAVVFVGGAAALCDDIRIRFL